MCLCCTAQYLPKPGWVASRIGAEGRTTTSQSTQGLGFSELQMVRAMKNGWRSRRSRSSEKWLKTEFLNALEGGGEMAENGFFEHFGGFRESSRRAYSRRSTWLALCSMSMSMPLVFGCLFLSTVHDHSQV